MDIGITFFIFKTLCHAGSVFSPCIVSPIHVQEQHQRINYIAPLHLEFSEQRVNTLPNDYLYQEQGTNEKLEAQNY